MNTQTLAEDERPYVVVRPDGSERRYRTRALAECIADRFGWTWYTDLRPVR